jgi:phosphoserine phosphatase RsbU/P
MTHPEPENAPGLTCGEVRGGTTPVYERVALPGLRGVLYSRPCSGASGGDIHYLSICGSGLLSRMCLADVAGHGETIAAVGTAMHAHLLRSVDVIDERKVLTRFDGRLEASGLHAMTTAVLATYYPPSRRLTVAYAGHPPGWLYRARTNSWGPLRMETPPPAPHMFTDLPLGTGLSPVYTRHRFKVEPGDRLLLVTDGVLETTTPNDEPFDMHGVTSLLNDDDCETLASRLLSALHAHADSGHLAHDDVTFLLAEIVEGPPGPALWHVVKNRLLGGRGTAA